MKDLYFEMLRIRMIEEEISRRYSEQKMRMPIHLSIGQEAPAVGLCASLRPEDKIVSTHRGHAHYLAKGGSAKGLVAELYGKKTGCSRGHGGSMHLLDLSCNFWGSTSIVGGTIPVGVGLSFADKLRGHDAMTVVCMGDAAVEEGVFHEAANFASLHKLNVLFFLEDNGFSCYTPIELRQPERPWSAVADCHSLFFDSSWSADPWVIKDRVLQMDTPGLFVCKTDRFYEHCGPKKEKDYLTPEEWGTPEIREEIKKEIDDAFLFAEESPWAESVSMYAD